MRGTPPSTAPYDVFYVKGGGWIAVWFDLKHGKAEAIRKAIRRDFPDARWVPKARAWFLGRGSEFTMLIPWRGTYDVTLVSKSVRDLKERRDLTDLDDAAEIVYRAYKLGVDHGGKGGERLHVEWDCARSWDSMDNRSGTEPVDKDYFRRVVLDIDKTRARRETDKT